MAGVPGMLAPSIRRGEGGMNDKYTDSKYGIFLNMLEESYYLKLAERLNKALEANAIEDRELFIIYRNNFDLCNINFLEKVATKDYSSNKNFKRFFDIARQNQAEITMGTFQRNLITLLKVAESFKDSINSVTPNDYKDTLQRALAFKVFAPGVNYVEEAKKSLVLALPRLTEFQWGIITNILGSLEVIIKTREVAQKTKRPASTPAPSLLPSLPSQKGTIPAPPPPVVDDTQQQQDDNDNIDDDDDGSEEGSQDSYISHTDISGTHEWGWHYTGRNKTSQVLDQEALHQSGIHDVFLKELPQPQQIREMIKALKVMCTHSYSEMIACGTDTEEFLNRSLDLVHRRGEILRSMVNSNFEAIHSYTTFKDMITSAASEDSKYSYIINFKVFDHYSKNNLGININRFVKHKENILNQENKGYMTFLGMLKNIPWDEYYEGDIQDNHFNVQKILTEIEAQMLKNTLLRGDSGGLTSEFYDTSLQVKKNFTGDGTSKQNSIDFPYTFEFQSTSLELPHTEGWQNPRVLMFVNTFLESYKKPMSMVLNVIVEDEIELSWMIQIYYPQNTTAYHFMYQDPQYGLNRLPHYAQEFQNIFHLNSMKNVQSHIAFVNDRNIIPFDEYTSLHIHATGMNILQQKIDGVKHIKPGRAYIYYYNHWTLVINTEVVEFFTTNNFTDVTFITLFNKIPHDQLPKTIMGMPFAGGSSASSSGPSHGYSPSFSDYPSLPSSSAGRHSGAGTYNAAPPRRDYALAVKKVPNVQNWTVYGIAKNLGQTVQSPDENDLALYYVADPGHETIKTLDMARRTFTALVSQKYYADLVQEENMMDFMAKRASASMSYRGVFVGFMLQFPGIDNGNGHTEPAYMYWSKLWNEFFQYNNIHADKYDENSPNGQNLINEKKTRHNQYARSMYNPVYQRTVDNAVHNSQGGTQGTSQGRKQFTGKPKAQGQTWGPQRKTISLIDFVTGNPGASGAVNYKSTTTKTPPQSSEQQPREEGFEGYEPITITPEEQARRQQIHDDRVARARGSNSSTDSSLYGISPADKQALLEKTQSLGRGRGRGMRR